MWPGSSIGGNSNWPEARYLAPALEIDVCFHLLVAARAGCRALDHGFTLGVSD
jgi:hypothetical protein